MTTAAELKEKARAFLFDRQRAYKVAFNPETLAGAAVLEDLAKFCRADTTTFHADPRIHALMEGRREVYLRIEQHLKLDPETLWKRYGRKDLE